MGRAADWWLNRRLDGDWALPISNLQGFRPVGGYLIGSPDHLEFAPNRFETLAGARSWSIPVTDIETIDFGRRRLRIRLAGAGAAGGTRTLFSNRPGSVRRHLGHLLTSGPASEGARAG